MAGGSLLVDDQKWSVPIVNLLRIKLWLQNDFYVIVWDDRNMLKVNFCRWNAKTNICPSASHCICHSLSCDKLQHLHKWIWRHRKAYLIIITSNYRCLLLFYDIYSVIPAFSSRLFDAALILQFCEKTPLPERNLFVVYIFQRITCISGMPLYTTRVALAIQSMRSERVDGGVARIDVSLT